MPPLATPGLVIRRADYGDYDRMVTLFTPEHGKLDAIARGCRRPKSPFTNAVEPFVSGEYQLFQRGDRFSIDQCQLRDTHFELREDYERLLHGVYWLKLIDAGVPRDVPARDLFLMTLTALAHLNYGDFPPQMLTMAYEMHFMALSGYPPRVDACIKCGRPIEGDARFDARLGGAICPSCPSGAPFMSNGARRILHKLPRTRFENVPKLIGHPDWPEAARLFRRYAQDQMQIADKFVPPLVSEDAAQGN